MTMRKRPPTRGSTVTVADVFSPGHIHRPRLAGSSQAANTRSRDAGSNRRTTSVPASCDLSPVVMEHPFERIEPRLPEPAIVLEPGRGLAQRRGIEPETVLAPAHGAADEARPLEDRHVLRH